MMQKDIRETTVYKEAESLCKTLLRPGTGQIVDAADVSVSPDTRYAAFTGVCVDRLEGAPPTRLCEIELATGDLRTLTFAPNMDRFPKYSPDGRLIAFLSDRQNAGNFQLNLFDRVSQTVRAAAPVEGWVEYLSWSPDGKRILLGVAGHGADTSGAQGGISSDHASANLPSWMPTVDNGDESCRWRSTWSYELATDCARQVSRPGVNVWEAVWCGDEAIAAVVSRGASEGLWYGARLHLFDVKTGLGREVYVPKDQLGCPSAAPSGKILAIVEAICSDRGVVAGDLRLIDTQSGRIRQANTSSLDITYIEWRSDRHLFLAGHRGFETAVGIYDAAADLFKEVWCSRDLTTGGMYISVAGLDESGDCVLVGESFVRAPEIAVIRKGAYTPVRSFDGKYAGLVTAVTSVKQETWHAPDGLEIQGWLLQPIGTGPHPLVMRIHGGPVWHSRPRWLGRADLVILMLISRGYAVFLPNPRGSSGRGQDFIRHVVGDMGGADMDDLLAGLDHLIARGIADPRRVGVTGSSYGGFMSSWLITQSSRFAAAVPIAPVTNWTTEHLISNIPHWVSLFIQDSYTTAAGQYFERSPVTHAHKAKTPTLNICGALDRCAPPEEALQFHNALLENGVKTVLVTYPKEGHGVSKFPAIIDCTARIVAWFDEHLGGPDLAK